MSHPPQCSWKQIHNATQKIRHCCNGKNLHAALDHILFSRIYTKYLRSEKPCATSQQQGNTDRKNQTVDQHTIHTFIFSHTIILTRKTHTCLCNGIYRHIQKSQNIICRCIPRHRRISEGIHGRLQQRVWKVNNRTLNPGRNSHLKNLQQINLFYFQLRKAQLIAAVGAVQA